jgi:hypothetical protein
MADGRLQIIGPKDEVLAKVLAASNASPAAQRPPNAQPAA